MPLTLPLRDETTAGESRSAGTFQFDTANLTLREIIRLRVQQEAARFNAAEYETFQGLVQPEETERVPRSPPGRGWRRSRCRRTVGSSSMLSGDGRRGEPS